MPVPEHERTTGATGGDSHGEGRRIEASSAGGPSEGIDVDLARARLEDLLLSLPYDRALPELPDLLDRAGIPPALLRRDDRLLKVLNEAVLARPLGSIAEVETLRTEVELLTLEVEVLTDRLADRATTAVELDEVLRRLRVVRARLEEVRDVL